MEEHKSELMIDVFRSSCYFLRTQQSRKHPEMETTGSSGTTIHKAAVRPKDN